MSSPLLSCCFIVAVTVGQCLHPVELHELDKGFQNVKAIFDDIHRNPEPPLLRRLRGYSAVKCYPEIGCFSPSTDIVNFINLYPYSPEVIGTTFRLYTKHNVDAFEEVDYLDKNTLTTTLFNPAVPIVFIVHGLSENAFFDWVISIKNELLKSRDVNVITVDWSNGAPNLYFFQSIVNAELVSRQIASLLVRFREMRGYDIKNTHMIGYSIGAHLVGFTGKYLKTLGEEQMSRITGLDPAGPHFEDKDEGVHLSYNDANFVDVIHTSAGRNMLKGDVGIIKPIGHADFYPNGGKDQPGCGFLSLVCSHSRAFLLFIESINSDCEFTSYACSGYDEFNAGKCSEDRARLGYHSNDGHPKGVFYLNTTDSSPYCKKS